MRQTSGLRSLLIALLTITSLGLFFTSSVNAAGPTQLTEPYNGVSDFLLSPDGQWAVLWRFDINAQRIQLESVSLSGGPVHHLADVVLGTATTLRDAVRISPDSRSVAYFGQPVATATPPFPTTPYTNYGLHVVPIDGSAVSQVLADDPHVHRFRFTPDSQSVVYTTGSDVELGFTNQAYHFELFRVSIAGGPPERVNPDLAPGTSVAFDWWDVLKSGHIVYALGTLEYASYRTFGEPDLYSVPIGASPDQAVRLNPCGGISLLSGLTFLSDRVVFSSADCEPGTVIRAVMADGSHGVRLSPPGMTWYLERLIVSEDERFAAYVYREDHNPQPHRDLYIAPIDGPESAIHIVRQGDPAGVNPVLMALSPGGDWVTYLPSTVSSFVDLHLAARADPTNQSQVLGPVYYSSMVPDILFSHDGHYLIFPGATHLASLDLTAPGAPAADLGISRAGAPGLYGNLAQVDSTNHFLVITDNSGNVSSVPVHGTANDVALLSHVSIAQYTSARITADGSRLVYISSVNNQLYVTQVDPNAQLPTATPVASPTPTATLTAPEQHVFLTLLVR